RPAVFDRYVLAVDIAGFLQALTECSYHRDIPARRCAVEESDHRHQLLRPRRERPRRRASEKRNEIAPPCMSRKQHSEAGRGSNHGSALVATGSPQPPRMSDRE